MIFTLDVDMLFWKKKNEKNRHLLDTILKCWLECLIKKIKKLKIEKKQKIEENKNKTIIKQLENKKLNNKNNKKVFNFAIKNDY